MSTKLKVLVVEDGLANIEAARKQLADHDLTVISSYDEAHYIITTVIDEDALKKMVSVELPGHKVSVTWGGSFRKLYGFDIIYFDGKKEGHKMIAWNKDHPLHDFVKRAEVACAHPAFDVVLTDVMMPKHRFMNSEGKLVVDSEMPYGPMIAFRAIQFGIKKIGILTSGNHHKNHFIYAFHGLSGFTSGDIKLCCSQGDDLPECKNDAGESVKNWKALLNRLL
jgi:CheY-like chemotaxis protein